MRLIAVVQARMGSSRLPGKVLEAVADRPLLGWTVASVQAIAGIDGIVVATTTERADDDLARQAADLGVHVHRGPLHDVLQRCWDAVEPLRPDLVLRQTADNPFADPDVAGRQVRALIDGGLDYVGIAGWPLGIAAEVCRASALRAAALESVDPAEREHVMPFIYRRPERFRIGALPPPLGGLGAAEGARFTVDTAADLAFARAMAGEVGHDPPVRVAELAAVLRRVPELANINAGAVQKSAASVDERAAGGGQEDDTWTS